MHLPLMTKIINLSFEKNYLPDDINLAEVSQVLKKK